MSPRNEFSAGALDRAVVAAALAVASLAQGCTESRRSLGVECLKSQDCLSGICSQFACAAAPPTIDTEENAESAAPEAAPPPPDAGPDAGPDASTSSADADLDASTSSGDGDGDAVEAAGGD